MRFQVTEIVQRIRDKGLAKLGGTTPANTIVGQLSKGPSPPPPVYMLSHLCCTLDKGWGVLKELSQRLLIGRLLRPLCAPRGAKRRQCLVDGCVIRRARRLVELWRHARPVHGPRPKKKGRSLET